jgi:DNA-binding LacI/PurR family transcriptional regulator
MTVTIKDVAREARVSVASVSRALNGLLISTQN